jgi:hypothetical protein
MKKLLAASRLAIAAAAILAGPLARAAVFNYSVHLDGASENPTNSSAGVGDGTVVYDDAAHTLALNLTWSGLTGTVTQTHFHATTATSGVLNPPSGVANVGIAIGNTSLPMFPTGAGTQSGVYSQVLNLTDPNIYNNTFRTNNGGTAAGAEAAFVAALSAGKTYWNIHTTDKGGGEIRGFPAPVPEPSALALAGLALAAVARRRKA